jgi:toxin CcdB
MIHQFDVVRNPESDSAAQRPYLVVLQSDLPSALTSTIVAPLVAREDFAGAAELNPIVQVEGRQFWLATHELFAVDRRVLSDKITTLSEQREAIMGSLDFVFTGF